MKAVIFAAGEGTRMRPLTYETPKPMLKVAGLPLIHYTFAALPDEITEVIVVVRYLGAQIKAYLGDEYLGKKVTYVEQGELNGTAGALWCVKDHLQNEKKFLVTMSDDLYAKSDIERCLALDLAIMVYKASRKEKVGLASLDDVGHILDIVEGAADQSDNPLINTNVFVITPEIFNHPMLHKAENSAEYGLPQTMLAAFPGQVQAVEATFWLSLTEPKDIERAEAVLNKANS